MSAACIDCAHIGAETCTPACELWRKLRAADRRVVLAAKVVRTNELAWAGALVGEDAALATKTKAMLSADKELEAAVDALLELEAAQ